jgi:hypothetical protein
LTTRQQIEVNQNQKQTTLDPYPACQSSIDRK